MERQALAHRIRFYERASERAGLPTMPIDTVYLSFDNLDISRCTRFPLVLPAPPLPPLASAVFPVSLSPSLSLSLPPPPPLIPLSLVSVKRCLLPPPPPLSGSLPRPVHLAAYARRESSLFSMPRSIDAMKFRFHSAFHFALTWAPRRVAAHRVGDRRVCSTPDRCALDSRSIRADEKRRSRTYEIALPAFLFPF